MIDYNQQPSHHVDPRQPLLIASASVRVLGIVLLIFAALFLWPAISNRNYSTVQLLAIAKFAVPGIAALVLPSFMNRHSLWAVIGALIIAGVASVYAVVLFIQSLLYVMSLPQVWIATWVTLGLYALVAAILLHLVWQILKCLPLVPRWKYDAIVQRQYESALQQRQNPPPMAVERDTLSP